MYFNSFYQTKILPLGPTEHVLFFFAMTHWSLIVIFLFVSQLLTINKKKIHRNHLRNFFFEFFRKCRFGHFAYFAPGSKKKCLSSKRKVIFNTSNSDISEKKTKTHLIIDILFKMGFLPKLIFIIKNQKNSFIKIATFYFEQFLYQISIFHTIKKFYSQYENADYENGLYFITRVHF